MLSEPIFASCRSNMLTTGTPYKRAWTPMGQGCGRWLRHMVRMQDSVQLRL